MLTNCSPSVDLQAMARVHRDGQKRPVFIYRFLTTGMIDEKIYQRQVTKQGLSDSLMDSKATGSSFSLEELQDLFRCHEDTDCLTHDMLQCSCQHDGQNQIDCNEEDDAAKSSDREEDDEEEERVSWMKASQVQQQDIEKVCFQLKTIIAVRPLMSGAEAEADKHEGTAYIRSRRIDICARRYRAIRDRHWRRHIGPCYSTELKESRTHFIHFRQKERTRAAIARSSADRRGRIDRGGRTRWRIVKNCKMYRLHIAIDKK